MDRFAVAKVALSNAAQATSGNWLRDCPRQSLPLPKFFFVSFERSTEQGLHAVLDVRELIKSVNLTGQLLVGQDLTDPFALYIQESTGKTIFLVQQMTGFYVSLLQLKNRVPHQ